MSIGSILVAVAVTLVVGAYLARPFRTVPAGGGADLDRDIEAWVAQVRAEGTTVGSAEPDSGPVNFCFECGRRVSPGDRFCPRCGTRLRKGGAQ
jgi:hypothetical protein